MSTTQMIIRITHILGVENMELPLLCENCRDTNALPGISVGVGGWEGVDVRVKSAGGSFCP